MKSHALFEGIRVYECLFLPKGSGMALPGIGILVYQNASSSPHYQRLLRHEFGHILQARQTGLLAFYFRIGIPSFVSAFRARYGNHKHHLFWTEVWADRLASDYFRRV